MAEKKEFQEDIERTVTPTDESITVNAMAEAAVTNILSNVFDPVAYMDPETVRHNIECGSEGGMPLEDRQIRVELANYLMSNLAIIAMGLIVNEDFRNDFRDAVLFEINIDKLDESEVSRIREQIKDDEQVESKGSFVVDFSKYNDEIYRRVNDKICSGFFKMAAYDSATEGIIASLSKDEKILIGFCVSNFMYAIRAFARNDMFTAYVKTMIRHVKDTLAL